MNMVVEKFLDRVNLSSVELSWWWWWCPPPMARRTKEGSRMSFVRASTSARQNAETPTRAVSIHAFLRSSSLRWATRRCRNHSPPAYAAVTTKKKPSTLAHIDTSFPILATLMRQFPQTKKYCVLKIKLYVYFPDFIGLFVLQYNNRKSKLRKFMPLHC